MYPWNRRFASENREPAFAPREFIANEGARTLARDVLQMTQPELSAAFRGSPAKRAELRASKRNAAVVLGSLGTAEDVAALQQALDDPEPLVREHAAWTVTRPGGAP